MYFRQILHEDLGCASYFLADGGEAVVVDPKWDVGAYLRAAREAGASVRHVLETHIHADHVSGRDRLAAATGASVQLPAEPGSTGLREGDRISVGQVTLQVLSAPGHRPEHVAFVVFDGARAPDEPWLMLSGDSLLVGDVARPDLAVEPERGAAALFDTLRRFEALADEVELWPAHIGGSLCGSGSLSGKPSSTLGYERRTNPLLAAWDRDAFVAELARSLPPRPPTVERVVALNREGPGDPAEPSELDAAQLAELLERGGGLLDVREPAQFDSAHLAGALNLPAAGKGVGTRAGWAVGAQRPIAVVAATRDDGRRATSLLHAAGVWNVEGISVADPEGWAGHGLEISTSVAFVAEQVVPRLASGELRLLDVRDPAEWLGGHVKDSLHLPLAELGDGQGLGLPADAPLAVACAAGGRAALAASVLRLRGYPSVVRVVGGVRDLQHHGAPWVNGG